MPGFRRTALGGAVLAATLTAATIVVACAGGSPGGAGGSAGSAGSGAVSLSVADSYIPLPAAGGMAAGYLTVRNTGAGSDKLVGVSSPGASSVTMHRSTDTTMEEVGSLPVPANGALQLARGGTHLMIMGWQKPPALGDRLELDLTFERGGTIAVEVPVQPLTYRPGELKQLMRKAWAWLVTAGALFVLLLTSAGPAAAHAALLHTDPEQNAVVASAPTAVTLTFSEGVTLSADSVRVLDPAGKQVDSGAPRHADGKDDTARVNLRAGLANGTYTVAWRAVSEDSHPVGGAFTFSIGAASDASVSASQVQGEQTDSVVAALYGTGRAVAYGAYALLIGAAAFVLICWPRGAATRTVQRLLMGGWVALLAATVAVLLLRGPYERGTGLSQAFDLSLVRGTLDERLGTALAARLLLLAAGGVFLSLLVGQLGQLPARGEQDEVDPPEDEEAAELRRLERRAADRPQHEARLALGVGGLLLALALAATWAAADHAAVGIQVWVALPFDLLHLVAMACWLGGLVTLLAGLRHGAGVAAADRFSKVALGAVATLVVTGIYQAWRGVGSWGALVDTRYGQLLLVKIGFVLVMLGTAWFSRRWTGRLRSAPNVDPVDFSGTSTSTSTSPSDDGEDDEASEDPVRRAQLARQQAARVGAEVRRTRDGSPVQAGLRRSVLIEASVAVAVLVVTTLLTNSPPGRVAAEVAATSGASTPGGSAAGATAPAVPGRTVELKLPYDTQGTGAGAKGTATITLNPARTGGNSLTLVVADSSGKPLDVPQVDVSFTLPDRDLGPLPVALTKTATGSWTGTAQLPLAGDWVAAVVVRSSEIDQDTVTKQLTIG